MSQACIHIWTLQLEPNFVSNPQLSFPHTTTLVRPFQILRDGLACPGLCQIYHPLPNSITSRAATQSKPFRRGGGKVWRNRFWGWRGQHSYLCWDLHSPSWATAASEPALPALAAALKVAGAGSFIGVPSMAMFLGHGFCGDGGNPPNLVPGAPLAHP